MTIEMGRKPYLSKNYYAMMNNLTDKQINDQVLQKQSEFKKPYMSDSYEEMEHFVPMIFGGNPIELPNWPIPPYPEPEWPPFVPPPNQSNPPFPPPNPPPNIRFPDSYIPPGNDYRSKSDVPQGSMGDKCANLFKTLFGSGGLTTWPKVTQYIASGCQVIFKWPPVPPADITYTTPQMQVNGAQTFTANCGSFATWSLSGGGSLSTTTGPTTVYTAPATNANCADNATITLKCMGVVVSTVKIAVKAVSSGGWAYRLTTSDYPPTCANPYPGYCAWAYKQYLCDGTPEAGFYFGTALPTCTGISTSCTPTNSYTGAFDVRTSTMKANGCCPAALL